MKNTLRTIGWILLIIGWIFYFSAQYIIATLIFGVCVGLFFKMILVSDDSDDHSKY